MPAADAQSKALVHGAILSEEQREILVRGFVFCFLMCAVRHGRHGLLKAQYYIEYNIASAPSSTILHQHAPLSVFSSPVAGTSAGTPDVGPEHLPLIAVDDFP